MATDQASTSHPPPAVNPPHPPPPHLALHTQTIAAPLHFAGNDPVLAGELSAVDFLRQMDICLLGNNVSLDSEKLAFALHALHGTAHEWYIGLWLRADFMDTFDSVSYTHLTLADE